MSAVPGWIDIDPTDIQACADEFPIGRVNARLILRFAINHTSPGGRDLAIVATRPESGTNNEQTVRIQRLDTSNDACPERWLQADGPIRIAHGDYARQRADFNGHDLSGRIEQEPVR